MKSQREVDESRQQQAAQQQELTERQQTTEDITNIAQGAQAVRMVGGADG